MSFAVPAAVALFGVGLGVGLGGLGWFARESVNAYVHRESSAAKSWDTLSNRAILKKADADLKTYFLKEQEYELIVREFQTVKDEVIDKKNYVAMVQILNRLRGSPFFDEKYRPEYDALWVMLTHRGVRSNIATNSHGQPNNTAAINNQSTEVPDGSITCEQLKQYVPDHFEKLKNTFESSCGSDMKNKVTLEDAVEALERKLRN